MPGRLDFNYPHTHPTLPQSPPPPHHQDDISKYIFMKENFGILIRIWMKCVSTSQ